MAESPDIIVTKTAGKNLAYTAQLLSLPLFAL